jgi:hypothetical protein
MEEMGMVKVKPQGHGNDRGDQKQNGKFSQDGCIFKGSKEEYSFIFVRHRGYF